MPLYDYKCDACRHAQEEYQSIRSDPLTLCPSCGAECFHRVPTLPHTDLKEYHTPIEQFSIAMETDEEIRDFMRKAPDVQVSTDPNDEMYGVPIAKCRRDKLQALKAAGYVEGNSERVRK